MVNVVQLTFVIVRFLDEIFVYPGLVYLVLSELFSAALFDLQSIRNHVHFRRQLAVVIGLASAIIIVKI